MEKVSNYSQNFESINKVNNESDKSHFLSDALIFVVILGSVEFYRISGLTKNIVYILQFAIIIVLFAIIVVNLIYVKKQPSFRNFRFGLILITIGVILSVFSAKMINHQPIPITLWAQRSVYFFFFYTVLHILKPTKERLIEIVFLFGVIYAVFYTLQYIAYPIRIFDVRQEMDRGTVRIFLSGSSYLGIAYLFALQEILYRPKKKFVFYLFVFLLITFLSGSRGRMFNTAFITSLAILFSRKVKNKFIIVFLGLFASIALILVFQEYFLNLFELTRQQTDNAEDDVRSRAIDYFLNDFMTHKLCYITGNGDYHFTSPYGQRVAFLMFNKGFFMSDVGIIGEYVRYGIFFVFGGVLMIIKALFVKINTELMFIKYFLVSAIIALPLASTFTAPYSIVALCIIWYLLDLQMNKKRDEHFKAANPELFENEKDGNFIIYRR